MAFEAVADPAQPAEPEACSSTNPCVSSAPHPGGNAEASDYAALKLGRMRPIAARIVAGLLAIASVAPTVMALALALFTSVVAAQQPDPTVPNGDPRWGHPDTRGDVAVGRPGGDDASRRRR